MRAPFQLILLSTLIIISLSSSASASQRVRQTKQSPEILGYWENWNDVNWWGNNIPGNCLMGCAQPAPFMNLMQSYTSVNYGFTFFTQNPNPDQLNCSNAPCPVWDGNGIYIAHAGQQGATVVTDATDIHSIDNSPGIIAMSEVCRLSRQGPFPFPRRCKISLGGWSDWARLGTVANAQHAGQLVAKMVILSFADGIDLDFEHLSEYVRQFPSSDEFSAYIAFVKSIRQGLDAATPAVWVANAQARLADLTTAYNNMPEWQKNESPYYPTNMKYMQDIIKNARPPYLEISLTTRFNGFINTSDPYNYLDPSSPVPTTPFLTDNELTKVYDGVDDSIDTFNIMAYDAGSSAGPLILNFQQIIINFLNYGPDGSRINIGFEPGDQAGGGKWEGIDTDTKAFQFAKSCNAGSFVWSINPTAANSAHWAPIVAQAAYSYYNPKSPYSPVLSYSKCDPSTGWIASN